MEPKKAAKGVGPLTHRGVPGKSFPPCWVCFPRGAGAQTPQCSVTASTTGRGDRGAGTHPQGGAPGKKSPGRGLSGKRILRRRGPPGLDVRRGGGSPVSVTRGRLGESPTGLEAGPKKEKSSPVRSGFKRPGRGTPGPALRAPPQAPPPPCRQARRPRLPVPASASHRKCGAAKRKVGRARPALRYVTAPPCARRRIAATEAHWLLRENSAEP